jgi:hypothetical protein
MQDQTSLILSKDTLLKEWQKAFGRSAPSGCHTSFLDKAIAWQKQALKHGGLTTAERRQLLGESTFSNESAHIGTRLIRVWQGETHQVTVLADGYQYKEQHWKSLSAIAKAITGTPWSGPLFFGLKK